jgi:para-aminobenzoate synthetase component I
MMKSVPFKKALSTQNLSHQQLLESLQSLDHVIFLNNNHAPLIGLLAQQYICLSSHQTQIFESYQFNQYVPHSKIHHLNDFLASTSNCNMLTMGFISYDFAAQQQIQLQVKQQPSVFLGQFPHFLSFEKNTWFFNSFDSSAEHIFDSINQLISEHQPITALSLHQKCTPRWSKNEYSAAFQKVQDYIVAGDCYQINLTQEFTTQAQGHLLSTADQFWTLTNAPYAGYLRIQDFELLSCSPELFIDFEENHKIVTKPIKGTMPRYENPEQDEQSKQTLKNSQKDQAENVMIVDLLRNDLSVYAEIGSVKTPKLFNIESFNQVHHMVSEIEAILKPHIKPFDVLFSALPGGSITGAPKIRAMQIIDELEQAPRGAYCGSMGYFDEEGIGSWNILIRSIQKYQQNVSLWAGGGITIASDCDAEYQECFDKVSAMLDLLNTWYTSE